MVMYHLRRCGNRVRFFAAFSAVLSIQVVAIEWRARGLAAQQKGAPAVAQGYLGASFSEDNPPVVGEVVAGSPAAKVGMKPGAD
jgi:predicted metalloprotease with PDZ domain